MCIEDIRELLKEAEVAVSEEQLKFIYENLENLVVTGSPSSLQLPYEKECKELRKELYQEERKMSKELRECPFCGKSDKVAIYTYSMVNNDEVLWTRYGVQCKRCNFEIPVCAKKSTAIRKWNTRPVEDALTVELTRYRVALCHLEGDFICRKNFASSDEEKMFLDETLSHIGTELDFNPNTEKGGRG
jgi:Lar family restriction alleviation protein